MKPESPSGEGFVTQALRFQATGRPNVRTAKFWQRYALHIRQLPAALERMSVDLAVPPGGRILDYGSAESPYRRFFADDVDFVSADLPGNPHAMLELTDDGRVPEPDSSFDAVLSTQVLEHVTDPELYLAECHRVLRPGGRLLLSTHGIFVYHPDPQDLWRWTSAGMRHIVERAGLEVMRFEGVIGLTATGLQLVEDGLYFRTPVRLRPLVSLVFETLMAIADRTEGAESRRLNAQVYVLVATKP